MSDTARHDHDHAHRHHRHDTHGHGGNVLFKALFVTLAFSLVEALAGVWSGSLALLSDAGHMLTDSMALGLAGMAAWLARRPPSGRHTYGLVRLEILAALTNSLIMLALIAWIAFEAVRRLSSPQPVMGQAVALVAAVGLLVNLFVAWLLHHGDGGINTRAALMHVLGDLLGSVAALAAGAVIWATGYTPIDPILSLLVSLLILVSAWRLLGESVHILMEGVPVHIELSRVTATLMSIAGVCRVHDLHVWTLSSGQIALSAHLELNDFDHWPDILATARDELEHDHGIRHATLQPEFQGEDCFCSLEHA